MHLARKHVDRSIDGPGLHHDKRGRHLCLLEAVRSYLARCPRTMASSSGSTMFTDEVFVRWDLTDSSTRKVPIRQSPYSASKASPITRARLVCTYGCRRPVELLENMDLAFPEKLIP